MMISHALEGVIFQHHSVHRAICLHGFMFPPFKYKCLAPFSDYNEGVTEISSEIISLRNVFLSCSMNHYVGLFFSSKSPHRYLSLSEHLDRQSMILSHSISPIMLFLYHILGVFIIKNALCDIFLLNKCSGKN